MTAVTLNPDTQLQLNPDITFGDVDGEIIALNIQTGFFLNLNSSGSYIFGLFEETKPLTLAEIYQQVQDAYEVEPEVCQQEVKTFLERCLELGLIQPQIC
ncbi:PqqD family peptide modification chaperone [Thermosynechococcaceae cyanobacterium BACA0444]|uniref:PqqD family peptide modification chaperone n=1 Tax=Pseudocalidococcus azoricus BACA0444 TaxID=2918990 RepID=A0AAE4FVE1_9CYAN|nr:PqqD family peptide modification chaperone [Pseudocalidococcus azoricus]MDS3861610.1 PqqD family peptide modification chaperone [Pseudocalidococcus azoricus BACA0444]